MDSSKRLNVYMLSAILKVWIKKRFLCGGCEEHKLFW